VKQSEQYEYQAYLLRLWRENEADPWRASLEDPHTGERRSFASLPRLLFYLAQETGEEWLVDGR
jgi:hypothetical protein